MSPQQRAGFKQENMRKFIRSCTLLAVLIASPALPQIAMDPVNPTCPLEPNWTANTEMAITPLEIDGTKVLLAEGAVDTGLPERMKKALLDNPDASEIWLRSPGGDARAGNETGRIIRKEGRGMITRVPKGWTCFSACNFVFMGGQIRIIEKGGHFMVHMFTMTGDRNAIDYSVEMGTESTVGLISEVEQESAQLAAEDSFFLVRMGVSIKLLTDIMYKQKAVATEDSIDRSTRRCLTIEEALFYSVANTPG